MARVFLSHSSKDTETASRMFAWLREHGFDHTFLDVDKDKGIQPGAEWEKMLYREIERSQAVIVVLTRNWLDSKWCFAEFAQARALGKAIFPMIEAPSGERLVGSDLQSIDLTKDRDGGLDRLSRALTEVALQSPDGFVLPRDTPPFPGLNAFEEKHAAVFFGRDDVLVRLIETLRRRRVRGGERLIALLGASGSGKSSLLRAGLVPRLKRDRENWIVLPPFRPEFDPHARLIDALLFQVDDAAEAARHAAALAGEAPHLALADLARALRKRAGSLEAQILIPIDQAEELFTTGDRDSSPRFWRLLSAALAEDLPFVAVAAMRSDYLGDLQGTANFTVPFEVFPLEPMPLERIGVLVRGPARVAGLKVDDDVVAAIAHDAATADALPLLAFTLRTLYERHGREGDLTLAKYESLGDRAAPGGGINPLENAVRLAAQQALPADKRTSEEASLLREAFVPGLVRVNAEGKFVRRPAALSELPEAARPLIEKLIDARLLVRRAGDDTSKDGPIVEVAHEALFRVWPDLAEWLEDEREYLVGKGRLEIALADWRALPVARSSKGLLTGVMLERAREWLLDHPARLSDEERQFIRASAEHEARQAARMRRVRAALAWGGTAAAVVLAILSFFALRERNQAVIARDNAARSLAFALKATDNLAVGIARDFTNNFDVPSDDKVFLAQRLDASLGSLLEAVPDSGDLRSRYAETLTSCAFMLFDTGRDQEAGTFARRASALLQDAAHPASGSPLQQAAVLLAIARAQHHDFHLSQSGATLKQAAAMLDTAAAPREPDAIAAERLVLRTRLAAQSAALLIDRNRPEDAVRVITDALAQSDAALQRNPKPPIDPDLYAQRFEMHRLDFILSGITDGIKPADILRDLRRDLDASRSAFHEGTNLQWQFYDALALVIDASVQQSTGANKQAMDQVGVAIDTLSNLVAHDRTNLVWRRALGVFLANRAAGSITANDLPQVKEDVAAARAIAVSMRRDTSDRYLAFDLARNVDLVEGQMTQRNDPPYALAAYVRLAARADLICGATTDVDADVCDKYRVSAKLGMIPVQVLLGQPKRAWEAGQAALAAINSMLTAGANAAYVTRQTTPVYGSMLQVDRAAVGAQEWDGLFDAAMTQNAALLNSALDRQPWLENAAYLQGIKASQLARSGEQATAAATYTKAIESQREAAALAPDNFSVASNIVYYTGQRFAAQIAARDWSGAMQSLEEARQVNPAQLTGATRLADLDRQWRGLLSTAEAALKAAPAGSSRPAELDRLDQALTSCREIAARLTTALAAANAPSESGASAGAGAGAGTAATAPDRRFDLRSLDLRPILAGTNAERNIDRLTQRLNWDSPPTYPGPWRTIVGKETAAALATLAKTPAFSDTTIRARIQRIRETTLDFYDGGRLLEAEYTDASGETYVASVLVVGDKTYVLDGTSPPIHKANADSPPKFQTAAQAAAYLRFFCSYVAGEAGAFQLIENIEELPWAPGTRLEQRLAVEGVLRPLAVWPDEKNPGNWFATACVQYSNALFHAPFRLLKNGMVEMPEGRDVPVASNLPLAPPRFTQHGRARRSLLVVNLERLGIPRVTDESQALHDLANLPENLRPAHWQDLSRESDALRQAVAAALPKQAATRPARAADPRGLFDSCDFLTGKDDSIIIVIPMELPAKDVFVYASSDRIVFATATQVFADIPYAGGDSGGDVYRRLSQAKEVGIVEYPPGSDFPKVITATAQVRQGRPPSTFRWMPRPPPATTQR